jgi:hypothetical protein
MIAEGWIKQCVRTDRYRYSRHADRERQNDGLALAEVEQALVSGRIIEQYPDTGRGESCLLVGFTDAGKPIHAVCAALEDWLVIVTVYIPTPPKFKNPYERG